MIHRRLVAGDEAPSRLGSEQGSKLLDARGRIVGGIDTDRDDADGVAMLLLGQLLDLAHGGGQRWTDGGAGAEEDVDQHRLAGDQIGVELNPLAVLVEHRKVGNFWSLDESSGAGRFLFGRLFAAVFIFFGLLYRLLFAALLVVSLRGRLLRFVATGRILLFLRGF